MLRTARHTSTWKAFGMAFAIVLTPALMQTEDMSCFHSKGEVRLETLAVEIDGEDMIAFVPEQDTYEVMLPESHEAIVVRAEAMASDATVSYNLTDGCPPPIESGEIGTGGGEVTLETMPEGHTILTVWVHALAGKAGSYTIFFTQPALCI